MRTSLAVLTATLFMELPSPAQSRSGGFVVQEALRVLETQQNETEAQAVESARQKAASYETHRFELRLADFARTWNDFVKEYSDHGTYNVKKARSLSRALKKLQAELPE